MQDATGRAASTPELGRHLESLAIEELDLVQATTLRVALNGTKIGRLDVQHAELQHFDLRGAEFDELDGIQSLAGATITPDQLTLLAGHLAKGLGLKVEAPAR